MSGNNQFDPVHATALDLSRLLAQNAITSVEIVQNLLQHIDAHNHQGARLNAVLSIPPLEVLLSQASKLDEERQAGRLRGPLHGIPIMLKVIVYCPRTERLTKPRFIGVGQHHYRIRHGHANNCGLICLCQC